jgi:hypothetical protein
MVNVYTIVSMFDAIEAKQTQRPPSATAEKL